MDKTPLIFEHVSLSSDFKLPAPVKTAWLQALESGEYKKGKHKLKKNGKYCCLGVLADACGILSPSGKVLYQREESDEIFEGSEYTLCSVSGTIIIPQNIQRDLAELNDSTETFEEVINYIREKL